MTRGGLASKRSRLVTCHRHPGVTRQRGLIVAWGDADPFFGVEQAERTASALPHADLVVYEGCGHFVPEERPGQLAADLRGLLERSAARC